MPKRATPIVLSEKEQEGLHQITKRHRSEQAVNTNTQMTHFAKLKLTHPCLPT